MNLKAQRSKDYVLQAIRDGRWQSGDKLPPERELASTMGVSHLTMRRGLEELVNQGVIVKKHGSGNFVADPATAMPVAVVFPSYLLSDTVRQPVVGLTIRGVEQVLDRRRYALSVMWYRPDHFREDAGDIILSRQIKGVVMWGHHLLQEDALKLLLDNDVKIVGRDALLMFRRLGISTFDLDRATLLAEALAGLARRGHKHVAVARYVNMDEQLDNRLGGVEVAPADDSRLDITDITYVGGYNHIDYSDSDNIFTINPMPTAVVVPDEVAASDLFRRCYERTVRIPDDLSVVSLSDTTPQAYSVPLSAPDSAHWSGELSRRAGEHLEKLLQGEQLPCTSTMLVPPIKWRKSTGSMSESCSSETVPNFEKSFSSIVAQEELSLTPA